jgi:hypothetical protein
VKFPRSLAVLLMAVGLAGCGGSYRYKLTMAVNTPAGVRRASSVVEVDLSSVYFPVNGGVISKQRGEALYLDLGAGERPLIALLTSQLHPKRGLAARWTRDGGPEIRFILGLYGETPSLNDRMGDASRVARLRSPRVISPGDLPDLVTFADVDDPSTVTEVNPNNLQETLGPDVGWAEITIEVTDEPITQGIVTKLPWLPSYDDKMLDGDHLHDKTTLANSLSTLGFYQGAELKAAK